MLHALFAFVAIKASSRHPRAQHDAVASRQRAIVASPLAFGDAVNFHAIAGRKQHRLRAADVLAQLAVDLGVAGDTLARFHVRGVMAEADAKKIHQSGRVWETNVMAQRPRSPR